MKGLLIQEFKTLFRSPAAISILIIPVVLMIGLGYLLPSGWIVPSAVTIGIVASVLLYFGGSLEEIKRTSFMKSISLTRLNKFSFLAIKILFSIFISVISVVWVILFAWIFTVPVPFLATDFSHLIPPSDKEGFQLVTLPFEIDWTGINWLLMLYAGIITITVSITIAFVFVAFSKSSLSFYLLTFGYLLSMLLFGGVVMPSFLIDKDTNGWFTYLYYIIPNYYTNNIMAASFSGGLIPSVVHAITDDLDKLIADKTNIEEWIKFARENNDLVVAIFNDESTLNFISNLLNMDVSSITSIVIDGKTYEGADIASVVNGDNSTLIDFLLNHKGDEIIVNYDADHIPKHRSFELENTSVFYNQFAALIEKEGGFNYANIVFKVIIDVPNWIPILPNNIHIDEQFIHNALVKGESFEIVNSILTLANNHPDVTNKLLDLLSVIDDGKFASIVNLVRSIVPTIQNAYGNVEITDHIVPWSETILFLIIAAKFFKWS